MPFWTQIVQHQAPCTAHLRVGDCLDIFLQLRRAPGAWNGGFGGSDFDENQCSSPKHNFCENSRFASTRTRFSRFWESGNHTKIVQNPMQNGTWQITMEKTWKAKLWSRNFVHQGAFRMTRDAQELPKSSPIGIQVLLPSKHRSLFCALRLAWDALGRYFLDF